MKAMHTVNKRLDSRMETLFKSTPIKSDRRGDTHTHAYTIKRVLQGVQGDKQREKTFLPKFKLNQIDKNQQ